MRSVKISRETYKRLSMYGYTKIYEQNGFGYYEHHEYDELVVFDPESMRLPVPTDDLALELADKIFKIG